MPMTSMYRNQVVRIQKEIAKLQSDVSREAKTIADLSRRINSANKSISSSSSQGTINSKLREIERHQDNIARAEKKRADLEGKIARKTTELNRAKENLSREEQRDAKKAQKEAEKRQRQQEQTFNNINHSLQTHDQQIYETAQAVQRLQQPVENITVLFFASNPLDQQNLQLDEEIRAIDEMIRKSEHRDAVKLESKWAVRPADVLQGLNQYSPQVVHISGHGSSNSELVFQDDTGQTKLVSIEAMVQLMAASSSSIRFVFFNSCYSYAQAKAIVGHVEATIGMRTAIGDRAARVFASQFYSAIGFGKSVKVAFDQAKALLMMEGIKEENTPELFVAEGLNPDEIILVTPPNNGDEDNNQLEFYP